MCVFIFIYIYVVLYECIYVVWLHVLCLFLVCVDECSCCHSTTGPFILLNVHNNKPFDSGKKKKGAEADETQKLNFELCSCWFSSSFGSFSPFTSPSSRAREYLLESS